MLELRGLVKRYGDLLALDDVGFSVARGEIFGFVGPNGAGKSVAHRGGTPVWVQRLRDIVDLHEP